MKRYILYNLIIILTACTSGHKQEPEKKEQPKEENQETKIISFTKKQFEAVGIQIGKFSQKNLKTTIKANGTLELPPQNKANVTSFINGNITRILVTEGQAVKKGQVLGYIAHPDIISMEQQYLEGLSQLSYLEKEFLRQKELKEGNVGAAKTFQKTESDYKEMQARLKAIETKLALIHLNPASIASGQFSREASIVAPIDGYIADIKVNIGSSVTGADELFEITDNRHIHADLLVYEQDIYKIHEGQKVQFMLTNLPGQVFTADIFAVGKSFEKDVKAVKIHAAIDNPNGQLLPGTYIDARIQVDKSFVNAVPSAAIVKEGDKEYIFKVAHMHKETAHKHEESEHLDIKEELGDVYTFQKVEVKAGATDAGFTEIIPLEEISPEAKIVLQGAYYISAQGKGGKEEE
jgi:cobalt-zinc-cadmium efflux system membrane fusion protein